MTDLPAIEFDGKIVTPKGGVYHCPHRCGKSGYPQPSWKTESGFRKHMEKCPKGSHAQASQETAEAERIEAIAAFSRSHIFKHSVGDTLHYVHRSVVHPTHKNGRKVRYEEVCSFRAASLVVAKTGATMAYGQIVACYFNAHGSFVLESEAEVDRNVSDAKATLLQKSHDEHLRFSAMCR